MAGEEGRQGVLGLPVRLVERGFLGLVVRRQEGGDEVCGAGFEPVEEGEMEGGGGVVDDGEDVWVEGW